VRKLSDLPGSDAERLAPGAEVVDKRGVLQLAGYCEPASGHGGDWWAHHDLGDGRVLVIIGDATGHGAASTRVAQTAKRAVDELRAGPDDGLTVARVLEHLNEAVCHCTDRRLAMTCFATIIDTHEMSVTYANAGHNFPYLHRERNGGRKLRVMMTRGNRLGDSKESTYRVKTEPIQPGDTIVWYTDGIVECENGVGREYGEKRFRSSICRASGFAVADLRREVVSSARDFYGGVPRKDDITLVFARVYQRGEAPPVPDSGEPDGHQ
jgi:serine phosphatase RsbU (regulator of sigma subunit)